MRGNPCVGSCMEGCVYTFERNWLLMFVLCFIDFVKEWCGVEIGFKSGLEVVIFS